MAFVDPPQSLTQALRSFKRVAYSLAAPLAVFDQAFDTLELDRLDVALPLVDFDPLAQFSLLESDRSTVAQTTSSQKLQPHWHVNPTLSNPQPELSSANRDRSPNSTADFTPVFPLERSSAHHPGVPSIHQPLQNPSISVSPTASTVSSSTLERSEASANLVSGNGMEIESSLAAPQRDRSSVSVDAATAQAMAVFGNNQLPQSTVQPSRPFVTNAASEPDSMGEMQTITIIETVVDQLLTNSNSSSSHEEFRDDSLPAPSQSGAIDGIDHVSYSTANPAIESSTASHVPIDPSALSLPPFNLNAAASHPVSNGHFGAETKFPLLDLEVSDQMSPGALSEMAETLTLLVNDVLVEQARRHGVDLS